MIDPGVLRDLFDKAVSLVPQDRAAFLDRACGQDAALRRDVERLLAADARGGALLESLDGGTHGKDATSSRGDAPNALTSGAHVGP